MRKKNIISIALSVFLSFVFVAVATYASTTISTNISTGGTLSVTGLSTLLGGATTTSLTLLNGEIISNATDGTIQLGGIASSTSLTLLNGETITNASDGIIAVTAASTTFSGDVLLGDAVADTTIFKGRITTGNEAGSELDLGASYTRGEGLEMRYGISAWTGIAGSFKGYYFRTEGNVGHATYGLRGMEVYSVLDIDSGTTGIGSLTGLYSELLVKSPSTSFTIDGYPNAIEANFSYEARSGSAETTITNGVAALVAKIQTATGLASYTNLDGIRIVGRDADAVRVMGDGLAIENDAVGSHATWTNAIAISAGAATGINITGAMTAADISLMNGETIDNLTNGTIKFTSNAGTITTNNYGIDLAYTGTLTSGKYMVGIRSAVTTAGTAGTAAVGIFGTVTQGATKNVNGYITGGEFEINNSNTAPSELFTLVLDSNSAVYDSNSAYIWGQDFGAADMPNLLKITGNDVGTVSATTMFSTYPEATEPVTHSLKVMIDGTPYWIMMTNVAPH